MKKIKLKRNKILPGVFLFIFSLTIIMLVVSYDADSLTNKKTQVLNYGATEPSGVDAKSMVFYILLAPIFFFHSLWLIIVPYVEYDGVVLSVYYNVRKVRHFRFENIDKVVINSSNIIITHKEGYKAKISAMFLSKTKFDELKKALSDKGY